MTRSLYAILNVSPDADPAVIEAAHRALIKKYHPDVLIGEPDDLQRRAAEINEAFQILRDPDKRARYDASEQARREAARAALPGNDNRPQPLHRPPPRAASKWIALLVITAMSTLVFFVWKAGNGDQVLAARDDGMSQSARASGAAALPVSLLQVDRAISEFRRLKETSGLLGLSAYSQDCFAMQSRSSGSDDFDFCVAFDDAVLTYDTDGPGLYNLPQIPRFQPREVALRHASAGTFVSDDEAWVQARLARIRALTQERLRRVDAPAPAVQTAATAAPGPNVKSPPAARAPRQSTRQAPRTTPRRAPPQRRKPPRAAQKRAADAEFMERQGYIY